MQGEISAENCPAHKHSLSLKKLGVNLTHIESRPSVNNADKEYDFYMDCDCESSVKDGFQTQLKAVAVSVRVMARTPSEDEGEGPTQNTLQIPTGIYFPWHCRHTIMFYVTLNTRMTFRNTPTRACIIHLYCTRHAHAQLLERYLHS